MLHEIKIKKEYNDSHMENDIIKKISKEKFFKEMKNYEIDVHFLFQNMKTDFDGLARFNFFLNVCKVNHQIGIYESILILEDEENDLKKLISLLNSDMLRQMERELSEKHKLSKVLPTNIDNYFIF